MDQLTPATVLIFSNHLSGHTCTMQKQEPLPIGFTTNPFDRLNNHRHDDAFLKSLFESPQSLFLLFKNLKPLIHTENKVSKPVWIPREHIKEILFKNTTNAVLLGSVEGKAHYAIDVSKEEEVILPSGSSYTDLMFALNTLSTQDCSILAQARGLMEWHYRHPFCSKCGSSTLVIQGGVKRLCSNEKCKQQHYPRNDPCVIMLVVSESRDQFVLARKKVFPPGMFTVLAGFLDQGESAEEAVKREVLEEVGLWVDRVEYIASQPWPLPFAQIMLGFIAYARHSELTIDKSELEDARWFSRAEITEALKNGKNLELWTPPARPSPASSTLPAASTVVLPTPPPAAEISKDNSTIAKDKEKEKAVVIRTPPPWAIAHTLIEHYLAVHPVALLNKH